METCVPGSNSVRQLFEMLRDRFGEEAFRWDEEPDGSVDAMGWRLKHLPRYLFSVSTHAGELSAGTYDFQVSIIDDSLENGEIILLEELDLEEICDVVARVESGEMS